jgi:hypothetical protein
MSKYRGEKDVEEGVVDHQIWGERNNGDYKVSIVARLKAPFVINVQYFIRLKNPDGDKIDYMTTLDGFRELGELLLDLHEFCKDKIYPEERDVNKLKRLLTPENIKNYVEISKLKDEKNKKRTF